MSNFKTMLYFNFKNYEEFKALFGKRIANNGKVVRSNGILLSFLKHEFKCKRFCNLICNSIDYVYGRILGQIGYSSFELANGMHLYHPDYEIDNLRGVCEDGDTRCIRYVRTDNGRVFKMKAGKFFRLVLEHHGFIGMYCEQVIIYACERFAEEWSSFVESKYGTKYILHVDDKFYKIYDSYYCKGSFDSCMMNNEQYTFYQNAVDASAAYLTDGDDKIVARCVIFNKVHDKLTGEVLRLAERQYSSEQDNVLKQILIDKLIEGKYIDGYKKVGVDCHSPHAFVLNDGTSLQDRELWIDCDLDYDSILSYQDSFKWYDMGRRRADNFGYGDMDLATTDEHLEGSGYDEYHDYHCRETREVYAWDSRRLCHYSCQCDVDNMDDFIWCDRLDDFYEYTEWSSFCDSYIPIDRSVHCELDDDYLLDDDARWCEEAQDYFPYDYYYDYLEKWKEQNLQWDEFNEEYTEKTILCHIWDSFNEEYDSKHVGKDYAEQFFYLYDGEWYNLVNEDGIPFHLAEQLEECEAV